MKPPLNYEYQDAALRRSFLRGISSAIVLLLKARGIELTEAEEAKTTACEDRDQLDRMLLKAATAQSAAELFE